MDSILSALAAARLAHGAAGQARPFVLLTWAQSLDGYIAAAPGVRTQISNDATSMMTHHLRAAHDAILIGVDTLLADDPLLTARIPAEPNAPSPRPVVLDSKLRTPLTARLLHRRPLIFAAPCTSHGMERSLLERHAIVVEAPDSAKGSGRSLPAVLDELYRVGLMSVMVEGGGRVQASFIESCLADFIVVSIAPVLFGSGVKACSSVDGFTAVATTLDKAMWTTFQGHAVLSGAPCFPKDGD
jgi:riboflavin-specific deaminase-like protein